MAPSSLRLICLPFCGASAQVYLRWQRHLPAWLELHPLELPGRGERAEEPAQTDIVGLARQLARELEPTLRHGRYAVFGHGLGALLACELLHVLRARGLPMPRCLFVSGAAAPARRDECGASLFHLGHDPAPVTGISGSMALPLLRADYLLCVGHRPRPRTPLDCPIHVLSGVDDRITRAQLRAWGDETSATLELRQFEGGHFYFHTLEAEVLGYLRNVIAARGERRRSGAGRALSW